MSETYIQLADYDAGRSHVKVNSDEGWLTVGKLRDFVKEMDRHGVSDDTQVYRTHKHNNHTTRLGIISVNFWKQYD